ncbi:MAG: helicase-related protein [Phenylobacterium sp.]
MKYIISGQFDGPSIQGQAVDDLISIIQNMFGRGAPNKYDDMGFNKQDYNNPVLLEIENTPFNSPVSIKNIAIAMQVLLKYKNRQLPQYDAIKAELQKLIDQSSSSMGVSNADPNKIIFAKHDRFGLIFKIPNFTKARTLKSRLMAEIENRNLNQNDAWKYFKTANQYGFDFYQIHPDFIAFVAAFLESIGYDVSQMIDIQTAIQTKTQDTEIGKDRQPSSSRGVEAKLNPNGSIDLAFEYDAEVVAYVKSAKKRKYDGDSKVWTIFDDKTFFENLASFLKDKGFEISALTAVIEKMSDENKAIAPTAFGKLFFYDVYDITNGEFQVAIVPENKILGKEIGEFLRFCFPAWQSSKKGLLKTDNTDEEKIAVRRFVQNPSYIGNTLGKFLSFEIKGTTADYHVLEDILTKYGYDTAKLKAIVFNLFRRGVIVKDKIPGTLDGYRTKDENGKIVNDKEKFFAEVTEKYKVSSESGEKFELYDQQKDGIAFLYSRSSAFLGDETGVGKCLAKDSLINYSEGVDKIEDIWHKYADKYKVFYIDDVLEEIYNPNKDIFVNSIDTDGKTVKGKINYIYRKKFTGKLRCIKTSSGKEIVTTFNHKFLTPSGWSNNIVLGDTICSSSNQPRLQNNYLEEVDEKIVKFIAWQIAEGNENKYTLRIYQKDVSILRDLKNIFDSFDFRVSYNRKRKIKSTINEKAKTPYLSVSSTEYIKFLERIGYKWGMKSAKKEIPNFIMNANDDLVKIFISNFFDAEGSSRKTSRMIEISSASRKVIFQLSILLQRFNIICSFNKSMKCATNGTKIKRPYYILRIVGSGKKIFMDNIGFNCQYKKENYLNINSKYNSNKDGKPVSSIISNFISEYKIPYRLLNIPSLSFLNRNSGWNSDTILRTVDKLKKLKDGIILREYKENRNSKWTSKTTSVLESVKQNVVNEVINQLTKIANNDLQYEIITSITEIEYDDYIYDLSIEKYHNYIAENIICHNTIEGIAAADMRLKTSGGRCLVVTIPAAAGQWERAIKTISDEESVSNNVNSDAKWCILTYNEFGHAHVPDKNNPGIRKRDLLVRDILNRDDFTCLILDECHMVKNDSTVSKNIEKAVQKIPYRWGFTATLIANKPMDAYRQLRIMGHRLGQLPLKMFKEYFGGFIKIKDKSKKGRLEKGNDSKSKQAAMELRKWLILSGVYIKRTKKDINPDLPDHTVESLPIDVDVKYLFDNIAKRLKDYDNPALVISQMQAARAELAQIKVPYSLELAKSVLMQDKKVIIFSCFIPSSKQLVSGLEQIINQEIEGGGRVVSYLGGSSREDRDNAVALMKDPDNDVKAMVISTLTGGTGLDLPNVVDDVIMNDFSWTPKDAEQSEGRAFRISSKNDLSTKYIVAKDSPDEEFYHYVQTKKEIAAIIGNLTSMEAKLILDGKRPVDIQMKIKAMQQKDKGLDDDLAKYISAFMQGLKGMRTANNKFNLKKFLLG